MAQDNPAEIPPTEILAGFFAHLPPHDRAGLAAAFTSKPLARGSLLASQDVPDNNEYVLIKGLARSTVTDADGRQVCLNLYAAPTVITPHMARVAAGRSLVDIELLRDGIVATISADRLMALMVGSAAVREWGNAIMRDELSRKVGREWCLAALNAVQRLDWFRANHPGYEDLFAHAHIASYLGMTPVTFSRARNP